MLEKLLLRLCEELSFPQAVEGKEKNTFVLQMGTQTLEAKDLGPGMSLHADIAVCPAAKREELFIRLMRGNLLGQETGDSRIGLSDDEKTLTLSCSLPYELDYLSFKSGVEMFVNYLIYWREEIEKLHNEKL